MIAIVQRVTEASVVVAGEIVGQIGVGLLVLAAVKVDDTEEDLAWMSRKLISLRIFRNEDKHFDLDVQQINGSILLVSNFTVSADTKNGRRPSLIAAAPPEKANTMFEKFIQIMRQTPVPIQTGQFGADMQVKLTNQGPATFILDSRA